MYHAFIRLTRLLHAIRLPKLIVLDHSLHHSDEPHTIHKAGIKLVEEKEVVQKAEFEKWRAKIIVDGLHTRVHRCATDTEMKDRGRHATNQIALLTVEFIIHLTYLFSGNFKLLLQIQRIAILKPQ